MTDEELVDLIRSAQAEANEHAVQDAMWRLLDRYSGPVLGKVQGKLPAGTGRDEEIAQDVLEAAVRAVLAGKEIDSFRAWIFRVAANKIADFWRSPEGQQIKLQRAAEEEDLPTNLPEEGIDSDDQDLFELEDIIEALMQELSDAHRAIVDRFVFDDRSAKDVAAELGESPDNVYQVAKRFREKLRKRLDDADFQAGT